MINKEKYTNTFQFKHTIFEIVWALIGPNYGFHLVKFTSGIKWNLLEIEYDLNDIMIVIQLFRIYIIFRFLISLTPYSSVRAYRVGKMMGHKINTLFSIRCIFYIHPVKMLIVLFLITVVTLAYMVKILEGPVYKASDQAQINLIDYNIMENCLWNILVTMTTVGYGDFYPLTNLGRISIVIAAFFGTTLISLMTLITGNKLSLNKTEKSIYDFAERLDARKEKDESFIKYTFANFKFKSKYNILRNYVLSFPETDLTKDKTYINLKKEVEDILYKKIDLKKKSKRSF